MGAIQYIITAAKNGEGKKCKMEVQALGWGGAVAPFAPPGSASVVY